VKDDCTVCHTKLPNPLSTVETKPAMSACFGCHEHKLEYDEGQCARCHRDLAAYGIKPMLSYSHAGNFVREHARPARAAPQTCGSCHDQTFCTDCHAATVPLPIERRLPERVDRDFIHRDDYVSRHVIEARADPSSCARCHGKSFCQDCHTAQSLTPIAATPRNPHPPGWSLPGSPRFHGTEARRDIRSRSAVELRRLPQGRRYRRRSAPTGFFVGARPRRDRQERHVRRVSRTMKERRCW
jgi:hypothetical protein